MKKSIIELLADKNPAFQLKSETLKHSSPVIFLEYHTKFVHSLEPEGEQIILNILHSLGYEIYDYKGNLTTLNHARVIIASPEARAKHPFCQRRKPKQLLFCQAI